LLVQKPDINLETSTQRALKSVFKITVAVDQNNGTVIILIGQNPIFPDDCFLIDLDSVLHVSTWPTKGQGHLP
jgi:hypothetical protein